MSNRAPPNLPPTNSVHRCQSTHDIGQKQPETEAVISTCIPTPATIGASIGAEKLERMLKLSMMDVASFSPPSLFALLSLLAVPSDLFLYPLPCR